MTVGPNVLVKLDLYGSTQTSGVSSSRFDRAVRRGRVTGLDNDNQDLLEAMEAALIQAGLYHHSRLNLPLQQIRATKWGPRKAWVELVYARGQVSAPTSPAVLLVRTATSYEHVPVFRAGPTFTGGSPSSGFDQFGLPTGHIRGAPTDAEQAAMTDAAKQALVPRIRPYMLRRPVVKIFVHTFLPFHPYTWKGVDELLLDKLSDINDGDITFGNFLITKWWIRFDGARCDTVEQSNGIVYYDVDYEFTVMRGGHVQQALDYNSELSPGVFKYQGLPGRRLVTPIELRHPETFMGAGAFPYHSVIP